MKFLSTFQLFEADHAYHKILDLNYSFKLYKVADKIWCLAAPDSVTLCSTFLRCQEFYEAANPLFQNNKFKKVDYIKWYREDFSKTPNEFRYHLDWSGFNLPSESIKRCMSDIDDLDDWDRIMQSIINTIEKTETGRWYLLGVSKLDTSNLSVLAHEMAHGMWYIDPSYKTEMTSLLNSIPKEEFDKLKKIIFDVGYAESSLIDECQAYLSTGLIDGMEEYEKYEPSFRKVFEKYNTHHSIKSPKPVKIDFI